MNFFKTNFNNFLLYLFYNKVNSNQRFICSRVDTNEVVNFYISDNKLFIWFKYQWNIFYITKYMNGILAINMSKIGIDSGIEVIFLDL